MFETGGLFACTHAMDETWFGHFGGGFGGDLPGRRGAEERAAAPCCR